MSAWANDVLRFWFDHLEPQHWYAPTPEMDEDIRQRFQPLWESLRDQDAVTFVASPENALGAVILFDQFPRNMFRDDPRAFATDPLARDIARLATGAGLDTNLDDAEKQFLYMPFMHSEDAADQDRSVELFATLANEQPLKFAQEHREMILRFGRYPHRNAVLGRESTPEEDEAIARGAGW